MNDQLRRRSVGAPAARSALLTLLGEYVLPAPDGVWQETLVAALGAMGYKTHAARQALARSVTAGWLRTVRHGRRARMYLNEETAEMLSTGAARIYSFGGPWEWDGRWLLVVLRVPERERAVRHQVRTRLAWAGFGSLGGGLWITPHTEREQELLGLSASGSAAELLSFRAEPGMLGEPDRVISDAWDLAALGDAYREFIVRFRRSRPSTPAGVFVTQTLLVHAWRKFPFIDPGLPQSKLPPRWPGKRAYELFQQRHSQWHATAQDYFRSLEAGDQRSALIRRAAA
jgi:phenylacetic acid degradation operon negative regulatory protein